jgi:hypothetical protein
MPLTCEAVARIDPDNLIRVILAEGLNHLFILKATAKRVAFLFWSGK